MNRSVIFGMAALIPAAFNAAPAQAHSLIVPLCTGDGVVRSVSVPVPGGSLPGNDEPGCCAKGCHTGSRKKSAGRQIDS